MIIKQTSYCTFSLDFKNGNVLINPIRKSETDIVIYSDQKSGYLDYSNISSSLIVKNAGEFEIKDIFIDGRKNKGSDTYVYTISADDITIGVVSFLTDINNIPAEIFETIDILLIGAGSGAFLSPEEAHKFVNRVSPSIAIYYGFKEQAPKEVADILDSIEDVQKTLSGLQLAEKSFKVDKDYVDSLESTTSFYFEI